MPTKALDESFFTGLDLSMGSDRIAPGALAAATNVVLRGGELETRPGIRGQFSAALAAAIYAPTPFVSGGSGYVLFVSGGSVYKWARGATSATLLTGGALGASSANAFIATGAGVGYLVDGALGLYRLNLSGTYAVAGLSKPTAPTPALTARTLEGTSVAADWYDNRSGAGLAHGWIACDPTKTGERLANNGFDSAFAGTDWTAYGPNSASARNTGTGTMTPRGGSTAALALTAPGDGARQKLSASGGTTPTMIVGGITNFGGAPQRVRVYRCEFWVHSEDATGAATVEVQVLAYSSGSVVGSVSYIAEQAAQASGDKWVPHSFIASFTDLDTDPDDLEVVIAAGYANTAVVYVDDVSLRAATVQLVPTLAAAGDQIEAQTYASITGTSSGRAPGTPAPDDKAAGYTNKQYIFRTFSSAQNWASYPVIGARVTFPQAVLNANPAIGLRLGLATVSSAIAYTAPGVWTDDGKSLIWRLDGLPAATLAAVKYLVVEVVGDQVDGVGNGQALFRIGPIQSVGSLQVGLDHWYRLVEIDGSTDATNLLDVVESDVSLASATILPTEDKRMGVVTIPPRVNASSTHFALFRYGGSLIDTTGGRLPLGFLVGIFSWSQATFAFGDAPAAGASPFYRAPANPFLDWTLAAGTAQGGTLIDNTPDGFLAAAQVAYEGREPAPSAPRDVALWDNRVWLQVGASEVWGSWLMESATRAGVYFTRTVNPGPRDPHAPIRGWWAKVQIDGDDEIKRIVPMPEGLAVFTSLGLWVIRRTSVQVEGVQVGYTITRVPGAPGLLARRAVCVDPATGGLLWLGPGGLWSWSGGQAVRASEKLDLVLGTRAGLSPSALSLSSLTLWDDRVVLCVPDTSASTAPGVAYVLEDGAWTKWSVCGWTGLCASVSPGDLSALIGAGADGQLYAVREDLEGDKALSASSVAGVPITVRTRSARGRRVYVPEELEYVVRLGAAAAVTFTVVGDVPAAAHAMTQNLAAGLNKDWRRPSRGAQGQEIYVQVEATTVERLSLKRVTLSASESWR